MITFLEIICEKSQRSTTQVYQVSPSSASLLFPLESGKKVRVQ
ncbi:hypothetical protein NC651_018827 [Populus alba x Populus x berolinensis]|nr:hypothetical protein NC651_018827 [Populus alba x Populus x berolinensis]